MDKENVVHNNNNFEKNILRSHRHKEKNIIGIHSYVTHRHKSKDPKRNIHESTQEGDRDKIS